MSQSRCPLLQWSRILKSGEIAALAREAGFGQRERKLTPRRLFWAMTLWFGVERGRTLAGGARFASIIGGVKVTRQAFHQRLSAEAADFLRRAFVRLSGRVGDWIDEPLPGKLATYEDCSLIDSTTLQLAKRLAARFPACRTNVRTAAIKLHVRMSLTQQQAEHVSLSAERLHDRKGLRISGWVARRLLLFDLGYLDYEMLHEIVTHGGAFACRLKTTSNGVITAVRQGCPRGVVGMKLNDVTYRGQFVDLDVRLGPKKDATPFRVVGIWNGDTREYHWYVTSLATAEFSPQEIAQIYALRWQIELLFKEWKSILRISQLPTSQEEVVLCLIYAALCAAALSRLVLWMATKRYRLPWHEMSTVVALLVITHFAAALGTAALSGRRSRLGPVLARILEAVGLHSHLPNNSNALADFIPERA